MDDPVKPDSGFDGRLRDARTRHGLEPTPARDAGAATPASLYGVGLRVGIELVSALVVATGIGWALDRWLHTMPLFLVLFMLMGGVAGVLNVWRTMAPKNDKGPQGPAE